MGVFFRVCAGGICLGTDGRDGTAAGISLVLANIGTVLAHNADSRQNFFPKNKNFVCIWGKMGYNKME